MQLLLLRSGQTESAWLICYQPYKHVKSDAMQLLAQIQCPTLVLYGDRIVGERLHNMRN